MAHLSKNQLSKKHLKGLHLQMSDVVSLLNKESSDQFLSELLGPEEKIMLTKRLAAIMMFMEGNSQYRVWKLLKLSPSTAERISLQYEIGKYKNIEKILRTNKTGYKKFWKTLEIILQAGMPPRGRGRWRSVFDN